MKRAGAPGGDLMRGKASSYQLVTSNRPITPQNFSRVRRLRSAPRPAGAGARQSFTVLAGRSATWRSGRWTERGMWGLAAMIRVG